MMQISILCPSRGRPFKLSRMIASAIVLANNPADINFFIGIDKDDLAFSKYMQEIRSARIWTNRVHVTIENVRTPSITHNNNLAQVATGDILVLVGDDCVFRTRGWDSQVLNLWNQYPDNILIAYFNDGRNRQKAEHFAIHKDWIKATGHLCPPIFEHFCLDMWLEWIAKRLQRLIWLPNLVIEHMHPKYGKDEKDETFHHIRREVVDKASPHGDRYSVAELDTLEFHRNAELRVQDERVLRRIIENAAQP